MAGEMAWSLGTSQPYVAREELGTTIRITAPGAGRYYVIGALYTPELTMLSGTLFGLLQEEGTTTVMNNTSTMSVWLLEEGEELNLAGVFVLPVTGHILSLFLYKMVGDEASLDTDTLVDSISVSLFSQEQSAIQDRDILVSGMLGVLMVAMMFSLTSKM